MILIYCFTDQMQVLDFLNFFPPKLKVETWLWIQKVSNVETINEIQSVIFLFRISLLFISMFSLGLRHGKSYAQIKLDDWSEFPQWASNIFQQYERMNEWMNEWMDTYIFEYDDMQCFILINKYNKTQHNFYHYTQG